MTKYELAVHLGEEHELEGRFLRHIEPLQERTRWSKDELLAAHREMHEPSNAQGAHRGDE